MQQLSEKQDKFREEMEDSGIPKLISLGELDMAMKLQSKKFDKLLEMDRELKDIIEDVKTLILGH